MTEKGWIKLHRKILDSRVFANEGLLKVWIWCLVKANHKEEWVPMITGRGTVEVQVLPGQFIYGRDSAAKELKMPPSSVRNRMNKLKNMQNLDIKEDRQYSLITIVNWPIYQAKEEKEDSEQDNQRTTKGQPKDTDKNDNNEKNLLIDRFNLFYEAYPRHIGRKPALKYWLKHPKYSNGLFDTILSSLQIHKETTFKGRKNEHIPYPASWLNSEPWNDGNVPGDQGPGATGRGDILTPEDIERMRNE